MKDLKRSHFKKNTREFCFDALAKFCPVSGKDFHLKRIFLGKHGLGYRASANCFCSECSTFLYKEKRININRGAPLVLGKIVTQKEALWMKKF